MFPPQAVLAANPNGFPQGSFVPSLPQSKMQPAQFAPNFPQAPAPFPAMPVQNIAAEVQPRPRIRLQAADEPVRVSPSSLTLPPPESFGLTTDNPAKVDWSAIRDRLGRLGATAFRVDDLGREGFRVRILLNSSGTAHEIETMAHTEAGAVAVALDQAERWKSAK